MATILGLLWVAAGIVIGAIGWLGARGRLKRQHWAGIRLPATMRSDETWSAAHREAGPIMQSGGAIVGVVGLLVLVFQPSDDVTSLVSLILAAGLLACVLSAAVVGVKAANKVPAE
jgi:uncharacterized membrane protein